MRKLAGGFIFLMSIGAGGKLETNPPSQPENPSPSPVALQTRAHPFAAYIVSMHRKFHNPWMAWIGSSGVDKRAWAKLSIAVASDGKLAKIALLRSSGVPALDRAAIDIVSAAAPFPPTPEIIRSRDGWVHLDWELHEDERGCGTFGVDPHLDH